ncbi:MAG: hypothetical protein R2693_07485 [Nocardioidaceae bacterium]
MKVSPLAGWSDGEIDKYIQEQGILVNPCSTTDIHPSAAGPALVVWRLVKTP